MEDVPGQSKGILQLEPDIRVFKIQTGQRIDLLQPVTEGVAVQKQFRCGLMVVESAVGEGLQGFVELCPVGMVVFSENTQYRVAAQIQLLKVALQIGQIIKRIVPIREDRT